MWDSKDKLGDRITDGLFETGVDDSNANTVWAPRHLTFQPKSTWKLPHSGDGGHDVSTIEGIFDVKRNTV